VDPACTRMLRYVPWLVVQQHSLGGTTLKLGLALVRFILRRRDEVIYATSAQVMEFRDMLL
jgi:hypothetical protein